MDPKMMESPQEDAVDTGAEGTPQDSDPMAADRAHGADDQPNVTPEEQKQYDTVMTLALKSIYDKQRVALAIKQLVEGKQDAVGTIGHMAAMLMMSLKSGVQQKGMDIPDDVLYAVGQDVVGEYVEIAVGVGVVPMADKEKVANAALFAGMHTWMEQMNRAGQITPDVQDAAKQDLVAHGIQQKPLAGGQAPASPANAPLGSQAQPAGIVNQAGA